MKKRRPPVVYHFEGRLAIAVRGNTPSPLACYIPGIGGSMLVMMSVAMGAGIADCNALGKAQSVGIQTVAIRQKLEDEKAKLELRASKKFSKPMILVRNRAKDIKAASPSNFLLVVLDGSGSELLRSKGLGYIIPKKSGGLWEATWGLEVKGNPATINLIDSGTGLRCVFSVTDDGARFVALEGNEQGMKAIADWEQRQVAKVLRSAKYEAMRLERGLPAQWEPTRPETLIILKSKMAEMTNSEISKYLDDNGLSISDDDVRESIGWIGISKGV